MARIIQGSGTAQGEDGIPVVGDTVKIFNLNEATVKAEASPQIVAESGFSQRLFGVTLSSTVETIVTVLDESTALFSVLLVPKTTTTVMLPGRGYLLTSTAKRIGLKPVAETKITGGIYFTYEA